MIPEFIPESSVINQVKIFECYNSSVFALEEKINDWLNKNPNFKVQNILQTESMDSIGTYEKRYLTITIHYTK